MEYLGRVTERTAYKRAFQIDEDAAKQMGAAST